MTVTLHSAQVGGSESGVELRSGHLPNDICSQIHFLQHGVSAVGLAAEIDQEMSVGQQLDGIWTWSVTEVPGLYAQRTLPLKSVTTDSGSA